MPVGMIVVVCRSWRLAGDDGWPVMTITAAAPDRGQLRPGPCAR